MPTPRLPTPRLERETLITYNEQEDEATVWSASPTFQRKMEKLGIAPYRIGKRDGVGAAESRDYKIPKRFIRIVRPRKQKELTEDQRNALRESARVRFSGAKLKNKATNKDVEEKMGAVGLRKEI